MDKEMLTPAEASEVIGCNPHWIRLAAREKPELLGFPVIVIGNRTRIPRRAFVRFCEG
nr:MAG TPA: excisionase [Caudoviricetes sp.]